jgi:hypothetical protein
VLNCPGDCDGAYALELNWIGEIEAGDEKEPHVFREGVVGNWGIAGGAAMEPIVPNE